MPILFRLLYSCGLRVSEARLLKVRDVDLNHGVLTINHSKNDKSRLVPMMTKMAQQFYVYSNQVHLYSDSNDYYFPIKDNMPMTIGNVYKNFRKFLWRCRISRRIIW